ncbi:probable GCV1 - glycine decarboxylase, subunit T, mitochondrial [Melanopsichium pennsylvanicum]|uniref:Aminomethyltransferase n=2 Tax=Melanopsichium pennsylvanicum TaxID=63383 RepID=A0AAJ4XGK7_9BASI|nr:probable GCV1-glycine decarboxylase, subunit T, mitochondrial [Melanopsichium pennsylvanicum 4]SNX81753.1 probable GCV1 - glycine decarboxylase, subunit T, mitochondrial [Melanopsichium pennsylvanicum]
MLATRPVNATASSVFSTAVRNGAVAQLSRHLAARVTPSASLGAAANAGSISLRHLHSSSVRASDANAGEAMSSPSAPLSDSLSKTGLYHFHVKNGGKMIPFGGYLMPLTYGTVGQVASHHHVRTHAGLFDVGHMVQHKFTGPGAHKFLEHLTPASLTPMAPFNSTLSVLLNQHGGILDDLIITKHADDSFYVVTNAGCRTEDLAWFKKHLDAWTGESVNHQIMDGWGLLALQGPTAVKVLSKLVGSFDLNTLTFGKSAFVNLEINGQQVECHVARAGYTGEDGFEISIPPASTVGVAEALVADSEVQLAGLAARDSLRLEAGMCLYGHDLDASVSPIEAALAWCVGKDRRAAADFLGSERVLKELKEGPPRRRVGLFVDGGIAREGAQLFSAQGKPVGRVTSGIPSPTLGKNIAMALVENGQHKKGTQLKVEIRKKLRDVQVAKMPFVENKFYRG